MAEAFSKPLPSPLFSKPDINHSSVTSKVQGKSATVYFMTSLQQHHYIHSTCAKLPSTQLTEVPRLNRPPILGERRFRSQKQRFTSRIIFEMPIEPSDGSFAVFTAVLIEISSHVSSVYTGYQGRDICWQGCVVLLAL